MLLSGKGVKLLVVLYTRTWCYLEEKSYVTIAITLMLKERVVLSVLLSDITVQLHLKQGFRKGISVC